MSKVVDEIEVLLKDGKHLSAGVVLDKFIDQFSKAQVKKLRAQIEQVRIEVTPYRRKHTSTTTFGKKVSGKPNLGM